MKQIQLTQGQVALVDDDMFDYLSQWKWCAQRTLSGNYYACRTAYFKDLSGLSFKKCILMHRFIMGAAYSNTLIDHIDHCTLNNQRHNLRICTHTENSRNRTSHKGSSSSYLGVSWNIRDKKWQVHIKANGKLMRLGHFDSEIQAAEEYNKAALKYFGEFANPNIIKSSNSLTAQTTAI